MQRKTTKKSLFKQFVRNRRGSIAVPASIAFLAVILSAGAAVDYSRISHTKTIVADALDAALLAAAKDLSIGAVSVDDVEERFTDFFFANLEIRSKQTDVFVIKDFSADPATGIVSAKVEADLQMAFMGIVGKDHVVIPLASEVRYKIDEIELVMMLDLTTSMQTSGKMASLKLAAQDAVDILLPVGGIPSTKIRIGMVPYSYSINAGTYAVTVNDESGGNTDMGTYNLPHHINKTNCVVERVGAYEATDANYTVSPIPTDIRAGCPAVAIRPLTNDRGLLTDDINGFVADGSTAGHMGIAWTYYMLSENWQNLWPTSADPKDYSSEVQKIALLMTDGEFNTFYNGIPNQPYAFNTNDIRVQSSTNAAINLCTNMKAMKGTEPGIIVYSIAFKAPSYAQTTLKACATPDTANIRYYFSATNQDELRAAFQEIAANIQKLRITR